MARSICPRGGHAAADGLYTGLGNADPDRHRRRHDRLPESRHPLAASGLRDEQHLADRRRPQSAPIANVNLYAGRRHQPDRQRQHLRQQSRCQSADHHLTTTGGISPLPAPRWRAASSAVPRRRRLSRSATPAAQETTADRGHDDHRRHGAARPAMRRRRQRRCRADRAGGAITIDSRDHGERGHHRRCRVVHRHDARFG